MTEAEMIDRVFAYLYNHPDHFHLVSDALSDMPHKEKMQNEVKVRKILDLTGHIERNSDSMYKITSKGYLLIKQFGSYSAFLLSQQAERDNKNSTSTEKHNLEMQKLRGEVDKLTNDLMDYDKIKRQRNVSFALAIIGAIVSVILAIAKLTAKCP